jgi:hypothetical protein
MKLKKKERKIYLLTEVDFSLQGIPYGEQSHIPCDVAKLAQNMPKNRYKTTFPCK